MTVLIGVLAGILYLLVDFGIFHLVCHSRSITEGYSLFLVLLWMSMSYGFTNFAWIWLWISKDRDLFLWSFLILLWWFVCPLLSATFSPADMPQIVIQRTTGDYHGYMAVILFLGYLALIVYNLWQREYAARINLVWLLAIGILVQFGWEAGLLLGGIRSAGFTAWEDKLRTLLVILCWRPIWECRIFIWLTVAVLPSRCTAKNREFPWLHVSERTMEKE